MFLWLLKFSNLTNMREAIMMNATKTNEPINVIIDSNIIIDIYWVVENNSNDKVIDLIVIIKMNETMENRISK